MITSVSWDNGIVRYINQTRLPFEEIYVETSDYTNVAAAISSLKIRGAPAIGVAAGFAVCLAVNDPSVTSPEELKTAFAKAIALLSRTRPTAVNLFSVLARMRHVLEQHEEADLLSLRRLLLAEATAIQVEDIEACTRIGELGATLFPQKATVLTHCNTGSLATAGSGTAQSVITAAWKKGRVRRVIVDETRPLFQGARLTAWELVKQGMEVILITDSTAGFMMLEGEIDAVVVGADRIAANGDVANKIGTYSLAVLAHRHHIPFYVAAPVSTVDCNTASGRDIVVEERDPSEVTHVAGVRIAAEGVAVYAPAFDVTPHDLITAMITEAGILRPPFQNALARIRQDRTESADQP